MALSFHIEKRFNRTANIQHWLHVWIRTLARNLLKMKNTSANVLRFLLHCVCMAAPSKQACLLRGTNSLTQIWGQSRQPFKIFRSSQKVLRQMLSFEEVSDVIFYYCEALNWISNCQMQLQKQSNSQRNACRLEHYCCCCWKQNSVESVSSAPSGAWRAGQEGGTGVVSPDRGKSVVVWNTTTGTDWHGHTGCVADSRHRHTDSVWGSICDSCCTKRQKLPLWKQVRGVLSVIQEQNRTAAVCA